MLVQRFPTFWNITHSKESICLLSSDFDTSPQLNAEIKQSFLQPRKKERKKALSIYFPSSIHQLPSQWLLIIFTSFLGFSNIFSRISILPFILSIRYIDGKANVPGGSLSGFPPPLKKRKGVAWSQRETCFWQEEMDGYVSIEADN